MDNYEIISSKDRIDSLFEKISSLPLEDSELRAHWARYLCVLVSGFLEKSISLIYIKYSEGRSHHFVANFVARKIGRFSNANVEKIIQLTASFNPDWVDILNKDLDPKIKDSVNSLVANKNSIAHGDSVGITYFRVKEYYKDTIKLVEKIEEICKIIKKK